jgi:hypothetical protein
MRLIHLESSHSIVIDDKSGLIASLEYGGKSREIKLGIDCDLNLEINGKERRAPNGGLEHFDFESISQVVQTGIAQFFQSSTGIGWQVPVKIGEIEAYLIYKLNRYSAAFAFSIKFCGKQRAVIRDAELFFRIKLPKGSWSVNIPGNSLRKQVPIELLDKEVGISAMGELRGSSAIIHLSSDTQNLVLWPNNQVEIPEIGISFLTNNQIQLRLETNFSSDLSVLDDVELEILKMDLSIPDYDAFVPIFQSWMRRDGFVSPNNPPKWIEGAMIYEAQIGFSVFNEVNKYSPYPTAADLVADLNRISAFGFTCIQLMPKQPYPSYNIHDYWDIDTSYGNKADIKKLVIEAHKLGIKVILDILLHGVLDQEIIKLAADTVRSGPYADLITSDTGDNFSKDVNDNHNYYIAWSRHVIDFEKYWFEGSPPVSKLIAEHPDWFYRNSDGQVQGVYTKAFDARNIEWQDYFISACKFLMTELNIDGFRFDAPSYNNFPNWSGWARGRAGASALGCLGLFDRLRPVMKSINSESLLYTEPSGHVWRQAMDLNYNYDEQWLVSALCDSSVQTPWGVGSAKQLAQWIYERDRFLPSGSLTAHHIDSHDTFWWPSWGKKWRREQFGIKKVNLLTLLFGALPGPFMMFSGGEIGIEKLLPKLAQVKKSKIWLQGEVAWSISDQFPKDVFGILRTLENEALLTLINFSDSEITVVKDPKFKTNSALVEVGESVTNLPDTFVIPALSGSVLKLEKTHN